MAASSHTPTIALGLIAAPGLATQLASELADDLPAALAEQVSAEVTGRSPWSATRSPPRRRLGR
jgi:hypothetical protein